MLIEWITVFRVVFLVRSNSFTCDLTVTPWEIFLNFSGGEREWDILGVVTMI